MNSASVIQKERMLRRDLLSGLQSFKNGNYTLSRYLLQDVLNNYRMFQTFDDVLFYAGESAYALNYIDEAIEAYQSLIKHYPDSPFYAKAQLKIMIIHYLLDQTEALTAAYQLLMMSPHRLDDESLGRAGYLMGYTYVKKRAWDEALQAFGMVPDRTEYFFSARYLSAACYSNKGDDEAAFSVYQELLSDDNSKGEDPVFAQIQNNALLKLGMIYYERGDTQRALRYFNQVSEQFEHHDLSVIGKAWSAFREGKPVIALENAESILKESVLSSYIFEARVLVASAKDLLGYKDSASEDFRAVYQTGEQRTAEKSVLKLSNDSESYSGEEALLDEAKQIRRFLLGSSANLSGADDSLSGLSDITQMLTTEINGLDQLESEAFERRDNLTLDNIRQLRAEMIQTLSIQQKSLGEPLLSHMDRAEYLKYLFKTLLEETLEEKEKTQKNIREAKQLIEQSGTLGQFSLRIRIEIKLEELKDYYANLNQYEIWLRENSPQDFSTNLDQWANFSGYGVSNINFSRIKTIETRMAQISRVVSQINVVRRKKHSVLEDRIKALLTNVAKIEKQMNVEVNLNKEKERERFFEAEYFERLKKETVGHILNLPNQVTE